MTKPKDPTSTRWPHTVTASQPEASSFRNSPERIGLRIESDRRIGMVQINRAEYALLAVQAEEMGWSRKEKP